MKNLPTPHLLEQAAQVAEMLDAGCTNRRIAEALQVSPPRVSQIKRRLPSLRPYLGQPAPLDRLLAHREQLWLLRRSALTLAASVKRDLRDLDQELESASIDTILGLRQA